MSAGLSMASVNKIKELAESRDYSVAVDILDAQDLEKSLNPQFVRICGEVYENVGRYADARKQYVRAHIMADGNSKVIQSLVVLYLKRGFKKLAQKYYEQYIFIEKNSPRKLSDMEYIMKKANKEITDEMYETLYPYYRDNMDEEWSYELILLSIMMGKLDGLDILVSDYLATFKNSKRIEYIEEAFMDREKAKKYFDIFSDEEVADDSPEEDEVRALEAEQLEKDYYIRNPKEPEILLMVDDLQDELTDKQKRKAQRKNRKELLKSMRKEAQENSEEAEGEEGAQTAEDTETAEGAEAEEVAPVGESVKRSLKDFIKRKFRRENPEKDEEESEEKAETDEKKDEAKVESDDKKVEAKTETDEKKAEDKSEDKSEDKKPDEKPETDVKKEETKAEEKKPEDKSESEAKPEVIVTADETIVETEKTVETEKPEAEKAEKTKVEAAGSDDDKIEVEVVKADEPEAEKAEGSEEDDMRELKPDTSIDDLITYDFDDGFAPESETIAELDDSSFDFSNPFDSISAYKKDEEEKRSSEAETFGKTLDDLRIELEINNIDESTSDHEPAAEESVEEIVYDVPVEETVETVEEPVETVFEETVEEVVEAAAETPVETIVEETVEAVEEPAETVFEETVEKVEETVTDTPVEETVETVEESADTKTDDYPKFTSSLFPDLNKEKKEVKNEFDDVVKSESDKLEERLRKEAELQKQAEELLASLGIKL